MEAAHQAGCRLLSKYRDWQALVLDRIELLTVSQPFRQSTGCVRRFEAGCSIEIAEAYGEPSLLVIAELLGGRDFVNIDTCHFG